MKHRLICVAAAAALAVTPLSSVALAPAVLLMIKQIAQQAASSMIKDALLSSLSGMGCKGIALSNAISALDLRGGGGLRGAAAMGLVPGAGMMPGGAQGMTIPPEMAAQMGKLMPGAGQLPPGMALDPNAMAMMAQLQQSMGQPLSPAETRATMGELFELGFMPKTIRGELEECMVLVPATVPALGSAMGMMKAMIPQLREARATLHALPPAEQDEVAAELAQQLKSLPVDQRAALLEYLDSGFFPPRVAHGAKAGAVR